MTPEELKLRTKSFGIRVIRLVQALPRNSVGRVIGDQLLRSATSVGSNYRAACRARSTADFLSKLGIVEEEADEAIYWLEIAVEVNLIDIARIQALLQEANEILSIIVSSIRTVRARSAKSPVPSATNGNSLKPIRNPKSAIRNS